MLLRGRLPKLLMVAGFGVLLAHLLAPVVFVDAGDTDFNNAAIAPNNLGGLATTCADFCHTGIDGLDLWLSFENVCSQAGLAKDKFSVNVLPAAASAASSFSSGGTTLPAYVSGGTTGWTLMQSMFLCAVLSTLGLFSGFRLGAQMASVPKEALDPIL